MKEFFKGLLLALFMLYSCSGHETGYLRINQLGYRTRDIKVAVFISKNEQDLKSFSLIDVSSERKVFESKNIIKTSALIPFKSCFRLYFTDFDMTGTYRIEAGGTNSPYFKISDDVYNGTADFLLRYLRQQRCGFNPYIKDSCHTHDGYIIYGGNDDMKHIDVTGGWHDAADYLQYVATSANATYQLLFAFSESPGSFGDDFLANGLEGKDGIPDVLNEGRWGLEWLIKMNPAPEVMYNQIADDRDHIGFRLPDSDTADYGKGRERPVYRCTGKQQGLFRYKNRSTGIASTAGKFASAFARGSLIYGSYDTLFSLILRSKAIEAFEYGLKNPGVCQTAPGTAPYFYEEENWTDDMELAAIELFKLTKENKYLEYAVEFGRKEIVTPWMGADTARHYQWYPFVNMGHPGIASANANPEVLSEFTGYMKEGIQRLKTKGENNPFLIGVPFIWCSNNLVSATLTQVNLYRQISGDSTFAEFEAASRDWLFGCNPWGTSMVVGLPEKGDYPENTHSSYVVRGGQVPGGLVDGPVYPSIFRNLKYIYLSHSDDYAEFQNNMAVYHDDFADYSTNECTMDGTASLVYYLSSLSGKHTSK